MLIRELFERTIPPQDQIAAPEAWLKLTSEAREYFAQIGYPDWDDRIEVVDAENAIDQGNMEQADRTTMNSLVNLLRYLEKSSQLNNI